MTRCMIPTYLLAHMLLNFNSTIAATAETDVHNEVSYHAGDGYIIYCPCMGRFGNQAAHFLGALAFAKNIGRTLVLPPWPSMMGHIPFDQWFKVEAIETYHAVITAERFMAEVAPQIWPPGKRIGFCYTSPTIRGMKCDLKIGSPFKPFWDHLNIDFDSTESYNITYASTDLKLWNSYYPAKEYPVLAMKGAPASFPIQPDNVELHKYLWWSDKMVSEASHFIYDLLRDEKYIAIHLRNGEDWEKACKLSVTMTRMMSSPQCTGYDNKGLLHMEMCLPDKDTIIRDLRKAVEETGIVNIYVLTDKYPLISQIEGSLSDLSVSVTHGDPDIPQIDMIVAARADLFIGNCVSSFSAFIKRERDHVTEKPSRFFGYPQEV